MAFKDKIEIVHTKMASAICQLLAAGLASARLIADSLQIQPHHHRRHASIFLQLLCTHTVELASCEGR